MTQLFTRRDFLKITGATATAVAAGGLLPASVAKAARDAGLIDPDGDGYIPSLCEMCVWRCGLLAKVRNGRVVKLEGNPDNPHSTGKLCARGQSGLMNTYDPDRVLYPLIRVGPRGGGQFRRATWEEALDLVAQNMLAIKEKHGAEAMIFSSTHNLSQVRFENLLNGYGSPNYGTQRSLCFNAMVTAFSLTYGVEEPSRDYTNVKYILLVGRNLMEAISTSETRALMAAIARGAKLIVLDPRFTKTASKATEWIPIRPATDEAMYSPDLLSLAKITPDGQIQVLRTDSHLIYEALGAPNGSGAVIVDIQDWQYSGPQPLGRLRWLASDNRPAVDLQETGHYVHWGK